jgi:hypothetical protein
MRQAFSTPFIALLTLAFAICIQNVPSQNAQTTPAPSQTPAFRNSAASFQSCHRSGHDLFCG